MWPLAETQTGAAEAVPVEPPPTLKAAWVTAEIVASRCSLSRPPSALMTTDVAGVISMGREALDQPVWRLVQLEEP